MDHIIVNCPHCGDPIYIRRKDFNCKIFRHGVYRNNHQQIPPHLNRTTCLQLVQRGLIYGCAGPFRLIENGPNGPEAIVCGYI